MGTIRHSNYFTAALWAGLAAPVALYDPLPAYPYVISVGSVDRSFAAAAALVSAAWNQQVGRHYTNEQHSDG